MNDKLVAYHVRRFPFIKKSQIIHVTLFAGKWTANLWTLFVKIKQEEDDWIA